MRNQDPNIINTNDKNNNNIDDNYELENYYGDDYEIDEQIKEKLLNKGKKATCRIILEKEKKIKGSGFFSIITLNNNIKKKFLFTCNHVLDLENIELGNEIIIEYQKKKIKFNITNERFKITNPNLDFTIIEIFDKDNIEEFYEIEKNYYIELENYYFEKKGAIIHYPLGYDIQINGGTIKKIENSKILHTITTSPGSSGSPIFTLDNNYIIIGIHKGNNTTKEANGGFYMKYILEDIDKRYTQSFFNNKLGIVKLKKKKNKNKNNIKKKLIINPKIYNTNNNIDIVKTHILINFSNIIYFNFMNSSIQCFLQLKQFRDNILNINNEELNKLELTKEFRNLLIENNEINSNLYNMKKILSKVEEKYKTNEQCDANEFITIFLNQMLNELKGIEPLSNNNFPNNINDQEMKKQFERLNKLFINKNNSFLIDLFYGKLIKEIYCRKGHRISIKFQIYNIIELPIMEYINNDKTNKVELIDLLKEYQKEHNIDEKIECNECGKEVKCYSKTTIFNIPKYLILSLNQNLGYFPNLPEVNFEEIIQTNQFKNNFENKIYKLVGKIDIEKDFFFEYYITDCKNIKDNKWYHINDSNIKLINTFNDIKNRNAFILFYEKTDC